MTEGIDGDTYAGSSVLIETQELIAGACGIAGQIVELSKDVALLAQLLIGLDGSKEMGMPVIDRTTAAVKQCLGKTNAIGQTDDWCELERHVVVVLRSGVAPCFDMLVVEVGA